MKKLLFVLVVVSMASLLFTGCIPTTNIAPVITSTPSLTGTIGTAYTYTVTATDADGDTLTYAVVGPTGMVISTAGVISGWTPAVAGTNAVVVTVSDGKDPVTQSFIITVSAIGPEPGLVLTGIAVLPEKMTLFVEETEAIKSVIATYVLKSYEVSIDLEDCTFLTSDSKIATVDKDGIVTAVKAGTATITASYKDKMGTVEVTVSAVELERIVVLPGEVTLLKNYSYDFISVTAYYSDGTEDDEIDPIDCDYKSSDTDVVVVGKYFSWVEILALSAGTADITVSYTEGGITKTDIVEVTVVLSYDTTPPVIGAHSNSSYGLSAASYTTGGMDGYDGYVATYLSINEDLSSFTVWAYAGDPATAGVEKISLWRGSEGVPDEFVDVDVDTAADFDCAQGYSQSLDLHPGVDWAFYNDGELDIFFIALKAAVNPRVVITATDLAGNVATKTIALHRATTED